MEREDQIIKELIQEGILKSAPDDFTENVMQAVAKTNEAKKPAFDFSYLSSIIVLLFAVGIAIGTVYFFKPSFLQNIFAFFGSLLSHIYSSIASIFNSSIKLNLDIEMNSMIIGVIFIMAALLLFDRFLGRSKRHLNLFV